MHAQTGVLQLLRGEHIDLSFELLLTPTQPLTPRLAAHWHNERYAQVGYPAPTLAPAIKLAGQKANVINYHQGLGVNPYINYPFVRRSLARLRELAVAAHAQGMRAKVREACNRHVSVNPSHSSIFACTARAAAARMSECYTCWCAVRLQAYYTIRELSNHAEELWVLRALGDEILRSGPGGDGDPWLREHLARDYLGCWHNPIQGMHDGYDAALCNKGLSRWANFCKFTVPSSRSNVHLVLGSHIAYSTDVRAIRCTDVEGLVELLRSSEGVEDSHLDGLYYDGIDFGIETIRRVRSVLQRERGDRGLLDLHSGNNNHPNHRGKYGSVSPALQYMGVLPHIDSLWLGEGFEYGGESPDYWLIEISGLAFGTPSDLMCDRTYRGSAPWRGMLYGSFTRACTYDAADGFQYYLAKPSAIWQLADQLSLGTTTMFGYWQRDPLPVTLASSCYDTYATSYVRKGELTLIAIASWASPTGHSANDIVSFTSAARSENGTAASSHEQPFVDKDLPARQQNCTLLIRWDDLGLSPKHVHVIAPALTGWQLPRRFEMTADRAKGFVIPVPVHAQRGLLLVVAAETQSVLVESLLRGDCDASCQGLTLHEPPKASPPATRKTRPRPHRGRGQLRPQAQMDEWTSAAFSQPPGLQSASRGDLTHAAFAERARWTAYPPPPPPLPLTAYDLAAMRRHGSHTR